MAVSFVYRSFYAGPSGRHVRRFDADTVLQWFQDHWHGEADYRASEAFVERTLGCHVYGLDGLFRAIAEHQLPPPQSVEELADYLMAGGYVSGEALVGPHAVQVLTDD